MVSPAASSGGASSGEEEGDTQSQPESPCYRSAENLRLDNPGSPEKILLNNPGSPQKILLNNPGYSHFLQQADALRRAGQLCDAVIRVGDDVSASAQTFRAHRLVLACASGSLAQRLGPAPDPLAERLGPAPDPRAPAPDPRAPAPDPPVLTLELLTPHTFQQVLDFSYSQSLEVSAQDLRPLLRAARLLDMKPLQEQCLSLLGGLDEEEERPAGETEDTQVRGQGSEVTDETGQRRGGGPAEEEAVQSWPRPPEEETSVVGSSSDDPLPCDPGEGCSSPPPTPPPTKMLRLSALPSLHALPSLPSLSATRHATDATDATVAHGGASGHASASPPWTSLSRQKTASSSPSPSPWSSLSKEKTGSPSPWSSLSKEKTGSPSPWSSLSKEKTGSPSPWSSLSKEKTGSPSPWSSLSKEKTGSPSPWSSLSHAEAFRRMAESYSSLLSSQSLQPAAAAAQQVRGYHPFPLPAPHMYPLLASPVPTQVQGSVLGYPSILYPYAQQLLSSPQLEDIFKRGLLGRREHRATGSSAPSSTHRHPEQINVTSSAECPHCSAALLASPWTMHCTDPNPDVRCRVCGRGSRLEQHSTLRPHRRACGADKTYECQHCSKKFSLKHQLDTHLRTHTGEKPFECRLCGQRSRDYSAMIKHLRTHGGATPYRCTVCSAFCSSLAAMTKHLKTHSLQHFPQDWNITSTYLYTSYT